MIYGYAGNTLRIDLTNEKVIKEPLKQEWVDEYIGGTGGLLLKYYLMKTHLM